MGSRYLTDLPTVLRAAGLEVREWSGWPSRARSSGGYDPGYPAGIVIHHTASGAGADPDGDCAYIASGSDIAPIANLHLSRSGLVTVIAAGACNHAGSGGPTGWAPLDGANSRSIGVEAANLGTGEAWPAVQQDAYLTVVRALCDAYGILHANVETHASWCAPSCPGRKIDPYGPSRWGTGTWPVEAFRADLAGGSSPPDTPPPSSSSGYPGQAELGDTGPVVLDWQEAMIWGGWIADNPANRDAYYGPGMESAVEAMQTGFGWADADGVAGPHTWDHMVTRGAPPCPRCGL